MNRKAELIVGVIDMDLDRWTEAGKIPILREPGISSEPPIAHASDRM